ncbi:BMP family ABC transporter substrate-binding protein [Lysinibacter sp. HNR]|nr:BMP family ABC transporter substrate-binding protein [Lysinibacter sp. HNR]WGD37035.1 BMP family ABC transporter substrate-binding protein [Lysinibacter sp. HNR]
MKIISRKTAFSALASVGVVALLSACGTAPDKNGGGSAASNDFMPCMVSDEGGFDDNSFNQLSFEGLQAATEQLGVKSREVESNAETDYPSNLNSMVDAGCEIIVSVGFKIAEATAEAAQANPDVNFAIVDVDDMGIDNVQSIIFDTVGAAFLAGYVAADTTTTGVVGTFGGAQIPSVTIFMDGFVQGVEYYNQQKGTNVSVLGWDYKTQTGSFTGGFEANQTAKSAATALIDQNADIIMPVGGPIFRSAAAAITDSGKDVAIIGVDADLFESAPEFQSMYLTSVLKGLAEGVEASVLAAAKGNFNNTPFVGTLENGGVGIAPFHEWESRVSATLADELETVKAGLIDGSITATSDASPKQ